MWKLSCGAVLIVLVGATQAIPACETGCDDASYCVSTCYTNEENTLYTISTKFLSDEVQCKDGIATCPADLTSFSFEDCQAQCTLDPENCGAFVKDQNTAGDRCTFLKQCLSKDEAGSIVDCTDCDSRRTCTSCPSFAYQSGSTMVHWLCEMNGDAYSDQNKPAEGTECKPTANCATNEAGDAKPPLIQCVGTEAGQPGIWKNVATDEQVPEDLLADIACECENLRIPEATDTNVFCDTEHQVENGNYIIETKDQCEMVCDGQVFIPITCSFAEDKSGASWHIKFDGEDVNLGPETTCLACSLDNCQEDNPTEDPLIFNY